MRCLILLTAAVAWMTGSALAAESGETVYTNKTRFRIPFRYDHAEMQRLGAREVQLFVSTDRGQNWQLAQRVVPMAGRFEFRAPADGEYWFSVRTLDGRNELHPPADAVAPGLQVVVDTTPPKLELNLRPVAPGRVELSWTCDDAHLDLSQLKLEYIQTGDATWSTVQIVPQSSGQTAWSAPRGGHVAVRGSLRDRAANETHTQAQIELSPDGTTTPARNRFSPERPAAAPTADPGFPPPIPDFNQPIAGNPPGGEQPREMPGRPPVSPVSQVVTDDQAAAPPIVRDTAPPILRDAPPTVPSAAPAPIPAAEQPEVARRMVNSLGFQIEYAVDGVGPSGVGAVELFITENNGQKWFKYGDDADHESPFDVRVPREGLYGFAIRVRSGAGLADPPPRAGERPELIVAVDTTPPTVELMPIRQGRGTDTRRVEIGWRMTDANPAATPIALSYATDPQSEWQPITDSQPDTGRYLWTADPTVPAKVYLRVTARDAAGNQSTAETLDPLVFDTSRPSVRFMSVQSMR